MSDNCNLVPGSSVVVPQTCDATALTPEQFVNCILNAMQQFAIDMSNDATNKANAAISAADSADWTINRQENQFQMTAQEPDYGDVDNARAIYDSVREDILPLIQDLYDDFLALDGNTIFNPARDAAGDWLYDVIHNSELGIPVELEEQIFARERSRQLASVATSKKVVTEQYAAKGWKVAPGPVLAGVSDAEISGHRAIGDASVKVATFQAEEALKSTRFAVEQALKVYQVMLGAAADWVGAMVRALDHALKVSEVDPNVKANLIRATADMFRARISKDNVLSGSLDGFYRRTVNDVQLRSSDELGKLRLSVDARDAAAQLNGRLGMAGLSSFNGIVSSSVSQ